MIPAVALPVVRRAILDLLAEIGGEHNDDTLAMQLRALGHRVARRDLVVELRWLETHNLVACEELGPYLVTRIRPDGRDVAIGDLQIDGISRHKTGD